MANTTLSSITLDGDGNSFIQENSARKEAILTPIPLYLLDSDETDVFDFGGAIKTINLNGVFIGASKAACKTFMDNFEALITGAQDVSNGYPVNFVDDFRGTIKVKILDVETNKIMGEPLIVRWNTKLIEASTNA